MFEIGNKVKIHRNTYNHNYTIGKIYEIAIVTHNNRTLQLKDKKNIFGLKK